MILCYILSSGADLCHKDRSYFSDTDFLKPDGRRERSLSPCSGESETTADEDDPKLEENEDMSLGDIRRRRRQRRGGGPRAARTLPLPSAPPGSLHRPEPDSSAKAVFMSALGLWRVSDADKIGELRISPTAHHVSKLRILQ